MRSLPYSIYLLLLLVFTKSYSQGFWGNEFPEGKIPYNPRSYVCYTTLLPITLDGKITEKAWKNIPWTDSFIDIEGDLKPKPYNDTKVKMLWDEDYP